jgi:tetratricopeptide (TPR) repeat protein
MNSSRPLPDVGPERLRLFGNPIVHGILIAVVCLVCYSNTFHVPFQLDDPLNISEKPYVRDLSTFFKPAKIGEYRSDWPFRMRMAGFFTLAINYRIHGDDVVGYHIVNLVIHLINAFLVYFLVHLTFGTPYIRKLETRNSKFDTENRGIALFTALLFACHPIQTQAVTYIVQRFTSLATLFCLLSLVLYIKWRSTTQESVAGAFSDTHVRKSEVVTKKPKTEIRKPKSGWRPAVWYLSSLISAVLAMKTKEISFTLPLIICLYEVLFFEGPVKKRLLYLVPFLLTMLIIPLELMGLEVPAGEIIGDVIREMKVQTNISRWDYLFTEFRVIVTYIRLLFFPVNQNLDYDYPLYHSFFDPNVALSFLFLLSIFGIGVYCLFRSRFSYSLSSIPQHSSRLIAFGIFWFFITLSVESSVIPIADVIFEHRLYLPSVGFFIAVTAALSILWERLEDKAEWAGKAAAIGLFVVVFLLSGATYARNTVWQSHLSLWSDVLQKSPHKVRALNNFGLALIDQGDADRAADAYEKAIALDPNIAEPHYNMGKVYEKKGLHDKAIEEYKKAVSLRPDFADAFFDLGVAYAAKGMRDEAIMNYKIALGLNPNYAEAHFNLGVNYLSANLMKEARDEFEAALRLDPAMDQARLFLEYINKMR